VARAALLLLALTGCAATCPPPAAPVRAEAVMPISQELLERINWLLENGQ
jgi:hypothetical protein